MRWILRLFWFGGLAALGVAAAWWLIEVLPGPVAGGHAVVQATAQGPTPESPSNTAALAGPALPASSAPRVAESTGENEAAHHEAAPPAAAPTGETAVAVVVEDADISHPLRAESGAPYLRAGEPATLAPAPVFAALEAPAASQAGAEKAEREDRVREVMDLLRRQLRGSDAGSPPAEQRPPVDGPAETRGLPAEGSAGEAPGSVAPDVGPRAPLAPPETGAAPSRLPAEPLIRNGSLAEGDYGLEITIQNNDIREVLELLGQYGNLNILASPSVQGRVSATLKGVDLESALSAILRSSGYAMRREGRFIFVGTPEDFQTLDHSQDRIGTRVYRPSYIRASELQGLIEPLLTERVGIVSVTSDAKTGLTSDSSQVGGDDFAGGDAVLVRDYEAVLEQLDELVDELDVRPPQVHIEAMILSVRLSDSNRFGVNFELLRNQSNIRFGLGDPNVAQLKYEQGALKFGFLDSSLTTFLEALESVGETNVIATPRLMVLNKHRAQIQIGEDKGYVATTVTETSTTQAVEFLELGVLLRLRPFVTADGIIRLEVHPELSDGDVRVEGGFTLPNKEVTQVTTNIMVRDGSTVVIGGLMREQLTTDTKQIPLLGSLPGVGFLFRHKEESTERREVLVLLTPSVIGEPGVYRAAMEEGAQMVGRFDEYRDAMSPAGKRSIGRRYQRMARSAMASGDRDAAVRYAELAVHFDPLSTEALELRSDLWERLPGGVEVWEASTLPPSDPVGPPPPPHRVLSAPPPPAAAPPRPARDPDRCAREAMAPSVDIRPATAPLAEVQPATYLGPSTVQDRLRGNPPPSAPLPPPVRLSAPGHRGAAD